MRGHLLLVLVATLTAGGPATEAHPAGPASGTQTDHADARHPTDIQAVVGETVDLSCRFSEPGRHSVAWILERDVSILTLGVFTYSEDPRFSAHRQRKTQEEESRPAPTLLSRCYLS
ncbi:uncharacterized protein LOC119096051 isoform X2 [Pollicipes pollicipes]|uniref:uncharacterized protein LOC119096051 isoform X2 n=1 Tax=Pollicipes pollicipes TaxID=41117 RepID=UPI00188506FB|nr:uncharacterized protein LOC119096051 isoform X2 [Pollicipes pollicipes]